MFTVENSPITHNISFKHSMNQWHRELVRSELGYLFLVITAVLVTLYSTHQAGAEINPETHHLVVLSAGQQNTCSYSESYPGAEHSCEAHASLESTPSIRDTLSQFQTPSNPINFWNEGGQQ